MDDGGAEREREAGAQPRARVERRIAADRRILRAMQGRDDVEAEWVRAALTRDLVEQRRALAALARAERAGAPENGAPGEAAAHQRAPDHGDGGNDAGAQARPANGSGGVLSPLEFDLLERRLRALAGPAPKPAPKG